MPRPYGGKKVSASRGGRRMNNYNLAFIGFGNVGRALARLLLAKRDDLRRRYDLSFRVVGIAARRAGAAIDPAGIDLETTLASMEAGNALAGFSRSPAPVGVEFVRSCGADVLLESVPVDYQTGQPATDYLRAALESGMHAISANKGPVVHAYRELRELAARTGRRYRFESAVMDGAPIFSLWREALPAAQLKSFRGILNSTTNLILTLMENGQTFDEAVAQAQTIGVAETDPSGDILGWDAAVKVAALVTVLMDTPWKPQQVDRQGIEAITPALVREMREQGRRWKLVCSARRDQSAGVVARVAPETLTPDDPLYSVMGTSSSITFESDVLGRLTLTEEDPGPDTTAYGMLADFLGAVRPAGT